MVRKVTITAKIQIIVGPVESQLLDMTMAVYCDACNFVSSYIQKTKETRKYELNRAVYSDLRDIYHLKSQMAESVIRTAAGRYINKNGNNSAPTFTKPQYDLVWNRDYSLSNGMFSVNTIHGRIRVPYRDKGMEKYFDKDKYRFGTAHLVKDGDKYYLHIPVTYDVPKVKREDIINVAGIDRGVRFIIATYNSDGKTSFVSGKELKQKRSKYREVKDSLRKRKTASSRRRLKEICRRETRWMQDVNHCISKALVRQNPRRTLFVLEDLHGHPKYGTAGSGSAPVSVSWLFSDFSEKLRYKAVSNEGLVISVSPRSTSLRCPHCGYTSRQNRRKDIHTFQCAKCGYSTNDDRAAAMNLYRMGKDYLSRRYS